MNKLGEIFLDSDGHVVIRWRDDLGREITVNNLQNDASRIADGVAGILNGVEICK